MTRRPVQFPNESETQMPDRTKAEAETAALTGLAVAIAAELASHEWYIGEYQNLRARSAHRRHHYDMTCAVCVNDLDRIAEVAAKVITEGDWAREYRAVVAMTVEAEVLEGEADRCDPTTPDHEWIPARTVAHGLRYRAETIRRDRDRFAEVIRMGRELQAEHARKDTT